MSLAKSDVVTKIVTICLKVQRDMEVEEQDINPDTKPLVDLMEFDSLVSVSATVDLITYYNLPEKDIKASLFLDKDNHPLSISEIAEKIIEIASKQWIRMNWGKLLHHD